RAFHVTGVQTCALPIWMASGVKVAGFAGLIRVFYLGFPAYQLDWQPIVYALAVVTLVVGSVLAVVQTDVKRLLAYSSISHAGFEIGRASCRAIAQTSAV